MKLGTPLTAAGGASLVVAVCAVVGELLGYRSPAFAWTVHFLLMAWVAALIGAIGPRLSGAWFRVRPWEPALHRRLGAWAFMRLLRRVGWERAMRDARAFDGTRATLAGLERDTRRSELGHTVLAAAGLAMATVAAVAGAWDAVAWHAGLTVVLHLYPVALQRAMRARVGPLLSRDAATPR